MSQCFCHVIPWRLLAGAVLGVGLMLSPWAGAGGQGPPGQPPLAKTNVNGKYSQLLRKLFVPKDINTFTPFCDWGFSNPQTYDKYDNLPKGYWVYVAPYWYIWAHQDSYHDRTMEIASINGKYHKLLRRVPFPTDLNQYGKVKDFGYSVAKDYGTSTNLPAGYWVYVFPHWYIWAEMGQPLNGPVLQASVNCKYVDLLRKIDVPKDQVFYGDFFDEGFQNQPVYDKYNNLPPGFWVYVAPSWYIWGKMRNPNVPFK